MCARDRKCAWIYLALTSRFVGLFFCVVPSDGIRSRGSRSKRILSDYFTDRRALSLASSAFRERSNNFHMYLVCEYVGGDIQQPRRRKVSARWGANRIVSEDGEGVEGARVLKVCVRLLMLEYIERGERQRACSDETTRKREDALKSPGTRRHYLYV